MPKLKTCDICFEKVPKVLSCFKTHNCKSKVCRLCISRSLTLDYEGIVKYKCPFCQQFRKNIPGSKFHHFCKTSLSSEIFKIYEKEVKKYYSLELSDDEYLLSDESSESIDNDNTDIINEIEV